MRPAVSGIMSSPVKSVQSGRAMTCVCV